MITSTQLRSAIAARVALGLVVAGTLVGAAPSYAAPAQPCTKHFPVSNYHCTQQAYPNPEYPNHKPLQGNYPGSYTKSPSTPMQQPSSRFDWLAAGVGAAGMLGLILLLAAVKSGARMARSRSHERPDRLVGRRPLRTRDARLSPSRRAGAGRRAARGVQGSVRCWVL